MKTIRKITQSLALFLALIILFTSCASTTTIQSNPPGAKVYINGESVGVTPYTMTDTKIVGSCSVVRLEKDGHETLNTSICRNEQADVGAIIGGVFLLVPFLWTMKYNPTHSYELYPLEGHEEESEIKNNNTAESKTTRLLELKTLLDKGIITKEEFEIEKKKILNE